MNITPINSYSNQPSHNTNPQFKARFTEAQLREILNPKTRCGSDKSMCNFIPRLYTLLALFDKVMPGKLAKWKQTNDDYGSLYDQITIDGKIFYRDKYNRQISEVNVLEEAMVADEEDLYAPLHVYEEQFVSLPIDRFFMPRGVYEQRFCDNIDKTADDIIKDFSYVEPGK